MTFWEFDIFGVDISGVDILGVDILRVDIWEEPKFIGCKMLQASNLDPTALRAKNTSPIAILSSVVCKMVEEETSPRWCTLFA